MQLQDAPQPYIQVIPKGTKLRAFYVTDRGDAFVDLSGDVVSAHPGGSLTELLTVYAIVNAITANLPAVQRVQLLVDGKEVDTIAGHVDVRRPLERDRRSSATRKRTAHSKLKDCKTAKSELATRAWSVGTLFEFCISRFELQLFSICDQTADLPSSSDPPESLPTT